MRKIIQTDRDAEQINPWVLRGIGALLFAPGLLLATGAVETFRDFAHHTSKDLLVWGAFFGPLAFICCWFGCRLIYGASNRQAALLSYYGWIGLGVWFIGLQVAVLALGILGPKLPTESGYSMGRGFLGAGMIGLMCILAGIAQMRKAKKNSRPRHSTEPAPSAVH